MLAERRILVRGELELHSAIRLLEEVPPHELAGELVALAEEAAGCAVGLYVSDIGGSLLRLVAGDESWPAELAIGQSLGTELTRGQLAEVQARVEALLGGAAAVPLWLHGRAVAVLICRRRPDQTLEPLARQAAAAVQLADRYTDVFHRARRSRSTTAAAEIQENLLPPSFTKLTGGEIAAGIVPAYEIGGDWYDYVQNPEGVWLAVADAAGKGDRSAGTSTVALGALRAARRAGLGLADSARVVDRAVARLADTATFVTAVLAHWEPETRVLSWLRFGHPLPALIGADGTIELLADSAQLPLGLLGEHVVPLEPSRRVLAPGDRFVVTSDGVWERRTPFGAFGEAGVRHSLGSVLVPGAAAAATQLVADVVAASPDPPRDDATVLVFAAARSQAQA
jgi:serine phosphatase RsbU (regulator of sigma subunit)